MGTCHNIVFKDNSYIGDTLDIEMLKFSEFDLN